MRYECVCVTLMWGLEPERILDDLARRTSTGARARTGRRACGWIERLRERFDELFVVVLEQSPTVIEQRTTPSSRADLPLECASAHWYF